MAVVDWSDEQKLAFLQQQFNAQHAYYQEQYATAAFLIVQRTDELLGRLYVNRGETDIRIVDIALLPEFRGAGVGTQLVQDLLEEAARTGKCVSIHVERYNPALRWYQRLGFEQVDDLGVYLLLRWVPADHVKTAS
jgi:ribosomal protein S18 acetylase RimI-like enzyme